MILVFHQVEINSSEGFRQEKDNLIYVPKVHSDQLEGAAQSTRLRIISPWRAQWESQELSGMAASAQEAERQDTHLLSPSPIWSLISHLNKPRYQEVQ